MAQPTAAPHAPDAAHEAHAEHGDGHGDVMLVGYDGQMHPARLQHHFVSSEQQFAAAKLGMWLFLVTEILLFGGMFVAYAIYRTWYPELFIDASGQLDTVMGALNTLVLLTSSLTMAWAIRGAQMDNRKVLIRNLIATVLLAGTFMVVKYFEYTHKFDLGIFPGEHFVLDEGTPTVEQLALNETPAPAAPEGVDREDGGQGEAAHGGEAEQMVGAHEDEEHAGGEHAREGPIFQNRRAGIFFSIYYVMTGIHGLHVVIGMIAISILAWKARKGAYSSVYYTPVENVGLYWHVVDVIWIFLFPLMYLIN
ncbi:MAG TPA: cytochrome c oxidase subunit 3 family protein [Rubricoccaceae bacterium]|nr:cytochrome c oxidase subunit 3 family protein [Rubricoccaceae bacterium]